MGQKENELIPELNGRIAIIEEEKISLNGVISGLNEALAALQTENDIIPELNKRVSVLEKDNSTLTSLIATIDVIPSTNSSLKKDILLKQKEASTNFETIASLRKENETIPELNGRIAFIEEEKISLMVLYQV